MLSHRLAVGLPLGLLALASFLCPGWPGAALFLCFGLFLVVEGLREFHNMADAMHLRGNRTASYAAGIGFVLAAPLAAIAYVVWGSSYIAKLYFSGVDGRRLVLFLVVVTKASDVGAFTVGSLTAKLPGGNHKICPRLSPKKSWEGLGGGIVASLACAFGLHFLWPDTMTLHGVQVVNAGAAVFLGCVAPVVGLLGDVAESAFKRASGFKDSGNLPGLGGVLDILDSVIPVAPVFYAYIHFLALS